MHCAICGQVLQHGEASVATTDGMVVHITCADREAGAAWLRRRRWALVHGLLVAVAMVALLGIGMTLWLLILIGVSLITHPLIHHRVWHYLARDIRKWLGQRG